MSNDVTDNKDNYKPPIGDGDQEYNSFQYGDNNRNEVANDNLSATFQSRGIDLDDATQHDDNQVNSVY